MKQLIFAAALLFTCFSLPARAEPDFDRAVDLWLSGDDAHSLPMLADLAEDGHKLARLFLARIETRDFGPSPYRLGLDADQARALFRRIRADGRARSWIAVEAQAGNALAQALQASIQPEPAPEVIAQLVQMGERQATDHPTRILALYGNATEKAQLRSSPDLLQELAPYLDYLMGEPEARGDGLAALRMMVPDQSEAIDENDPDALGMAGILALGLGYGDVSADNLWREDVENWIMSAPSMRPITQMCQRECGDAPAACGFAFLALSGGYFEAIRYDSPLEQAVSQEAFLQSPRAQQMVLRRAALARTETNLIWLSELPELAEASQCVAGLVQAERLEYD